MAKETEKINYYEDDGGQLSLVQNFDSSIAEWHRISNTFVDFIGSPNYLINLLIKYGIVNVKQKTRGGIISEEQLSRLPGYNKDRKLDFTEGLIAEVPISQFINIFNMNKSGRTYQNINKAFNLKEDPSQLLKIVNAWQIIATDKESGEYGVVSVIDKGKYDPRTNTIFLKFKDDLEDELLNIRSNYTRMNMQLLGQLREDFIERLYERLKSRMGLELGTRYRNKEKPLEVCITFDLDELYFHLNLFPVKTSKEVIEDKHHMDEVINAISRNDFSKAAFIEREFDLINRYSDDPAKKLAVNDFAYFKRHYLDKAFKRINGFAVPKQLETLDRLKNKKGNTDKYNEIYSEYMSLCEKIYPTDIHFRYTLNRNGIGGKTTSINFYVSKAEDIISNQGDYTAAPEVKAEAEYAVEVEAAPALTIDQMRVVIAAGDLLSDQELSDGEIQKICQVASWNMDKIKTAYEVAKQQKGGIDSFLRFMEKAIREGWTPNKPMKTSKPKAQEEYTLKELMNMLGYKEWLAMRPERTTTAKLFLETIYHFVNNNSDTFSFGITNCQNIPAQIVKKKFLGLSPMTVVGVMDSLSEKAIDLESVNMNYIAGLLYTGEFNEDATQAVRLKRYENIDV